VQFLQDPKPPNCSNKNKKKHVFFFEKIFLMARSESSHVHILQKSVFKWRFGYLKIKISWLLVCSSSATVPGHQLPVLYLSFCDICHLPRGVASPTRNTGTGRDGVGEGRPADESVRPSVCLSPLIYHLHSHMVNSTPLLCFCQRWAGQRLRGANVT